MKAEFAPAAEADLEEIGDYIALDNPRRAVAFIRDLRIRAYRIAEAPEAWPTRNDLFADLRMAPYKRYLIFYRIGADHIRIERVLHAGRDINALFE